MVKILIDFDELINFMQSIFAERTRLQNNPRQLAWCLFAFQFHLHFSLFNVFKSTNISLIFDYAALSLFSGCESDSDGVIVQIFCCFISLLEYKDDRFIFLNAVDIIGGEGLIVAEEVIGLNNCFMIWGLVLGCLLQMFSAHRQNNEKQQRQCFNTHILNIIQANSLHVLCHHKIKLNRVTLEMGNSNNAEDVLEKGEGYRIIAVKENSPFYGKVQEFFDFIIEAIAPEPQKTTADILEKLSNQPKKRLSKPLLQIMNDNIDKVISVKIVSTKYRKVRTIEVTPNNKWNEVNDFIGVKLSKERFDEAFDTYFPVTDIQNNSPIKKAGIREGQYLIGCAEFSYVSIDAFMEGLYQRFFDKENQDKTIHIAIYDVPTDTLIVKQVMLKRGWGGKGLLGCDFLQGLLNKFPANLEEKKNEMRQKLRQVKEVQKIKSELDECDGISKSVAQDLHNKRSKKGNHFKNIRNLLNIIVPALSNVAISSSKAEQKSIQNNANPQKRMQKEVIKQHGNSDSMQASKRVDYLQLRVAQLQQTLFSVKKYLSQLRVIEEQRLQ